MFIQTRSPIVNFNILLELFSGLADAGAAGHTRDAGAVACEQPRCSHTWVDKHCLHVGVVVRALEGVACTKRVPGVLRLLDDMGLPAVDGTGADTMHMSELHVEDVHCTIEMEVEGARTPRALVPRSAQLVEADGMAREHTRDALEDVVNTDVAGRRELLGLPKCTVVERNQLVVQTRAVGTIPLAAHILTPEQLCLVEQRNVELAEALADMVLLHSSEEVQRLTQAHKHAHTRKLVESRLPDVEARRSTRCRAYRAG